MNVSAAETLPETPCEQCDDHRYLTYASGDAAKARRCHECVTPCPECGGDEYIHREDENGYTYAEPCPLCGPLIARIEAFNKAGIPARYHGDNCTIEHFKTKNPQTGSTLGNLPSIKFKVFEWVKQFSPGDDGFVLYGQVGTGKTHLLSAVIRHMTLEKGVASKFVEFTHLLSDIKKAFDKGEGQNSILEPLGQIPVLAIDELGKGRKTEWQLSIIDEIISKRYNRGYTTLFTTNFPISSREAEADDSSFDLDNVTEETLEERVGERIFSRLCEMGEFLHLDAPDFRKVKGS